MRRMLPKARVFAAIGAMLLSACGGGGGGGNSCAAPDYACPENQFCKFEAGSCGDVGAPGSCTDLPQVCTAEFAPVCSCDGLTFSSACVAETGGHSVRSAGECP